MPGLTFNPATGLSTTEDGSNATVALVLDAPPVADVVITLTGDDTEGRIEPPQLTFTPNDWRRPQVVNVIGVTDCVSDGNTSYSLSVSVGSSDSEYDGLNVLAPEITNLESTGSGIVLSTAPNPSTTEGGGSTVIMVRLACAPVSPVTLTFSSSEPTEGVVATPASGSMTFDGSSWSSEQPVIVTGIDDAVDDGDALYVIDVTVEIPGWSTGDPDFAPPEPVAVANLDDDTAAVVVVLPEPARTFEPDGRLVGAAYLATQPIGDVVLSLTTSDSTEGVVAAPTTLTFEPSSWDVPVAFAVVGRDDVVVDGDASYVLLADASGSSDPTYAALQPVTKSLSNLDDDAPGFRVEPPWIVTDEEGRVGQLFVRLTTPPNDVVTVTVVNGAPDEMELTPSTLTFNRVDWDVPHGITAVGLDDGVGDGTQYFTVELAPAQSSDASYDGIDPPDVAATNHEGTARLTFVTQAEVSGAIGVDGADALCNTDASRPLPETIGIFAAVLVDGVRRRACLSAGCSANGGFEHIDWPLEPQTTYLRPDGTTPIFTTDAVGIFDFAAGDLENAPAEQDTAYWTGLLDTWQAAESTCTAWATADAAANGRIGTGLEKGPAAVTSQDSTCTALRALWCVQR